MKILHVETGRHLYGGPQQVVYLMRALRDLGHDNTLVCPPGSGIDSAARAAAIPVRNLFCAGDLDLPFAYRLTQYLGESKPDIVHCHSRRGADVLGGIAASFADVPAVVTRRVDNPENRVVAALRYRPFRKVIAVSAAVAEVLRGAGVEDDRLVIIRDSVDAARFAQAPDCTEFRREFGIPGNALVIGAAGQLIARKGHRFLLQAMARLRESHPDARLVLFGDGELADELHRQSDSLGLGETVRFAGFRHNLDEFYACFDVFVHPALAEGLGVAALKASAAGVPVVAFRAGGLVEAVDDGETGLLVDPGDVDGLRAAIGSLLDDEARRSRLGKAGRDRMQSEFSIATMAAEHEALYESVIDA